MLNKKQSKGSGIEFMMENGEWTGETENRLLNNMKEKKHAHTHDKTVVAHSEVAESSNFKSQTLEMERRKLFS